MLQWMIRPMDGAVYQPVQNMASAAVTQHNAADFSPLMGRFSGRTLEINRKSLLSGILRAYRFGDLPINILLPAVLPIRIFRSYLTL